MRKKVQLLTVTALLLGWTTGGSRGETTMPLPTDGKTKIQFPGGDGTANNNGDPGSPPTGCSSC